jgi:hypothetical protein
MGKVIKGKWDKNPAGKKEPSGEAVSKEKVFQLHISLEETDPVICRRFLVPGNATLAKLHRIIQGVMGWTDTHLHEFAIGNVSYAGPDPEMDPAEGVKNEKRMHLYQVAPPAGGSFLYVYDFGDDWVHRVVVEKILDGHELFSGKPLCLEGEGACPPEDCGGPPSYYDMLNILKDEDDPEYEETMEWLGGEFDPGWFDIEETNQILSKLR